MQLYLEYGYEYMQEQSLADSFYQIQAQAELECNCNNFCKSFSVNMSNPTCPSGGNYTVRIAGNSINGYCAQRTCDCIADMWMRSDKRLCSSASVPFVKLYKHHISWNNLYQPLQMLPKNIRVWGWDDIGSHRLQYPFAHHLRLRELPIPIHCHTFKLD